MIDVAIKKLDEKAVVPFKKYDKDFAYDITATSVEEIAPNVFKYGIGLSFQIVGWGEPDGDVVHSRLDGKIKGFSVRPRSSIYKTGMVLSNCIGTLDELYTGQVYAIFYKVVEFGEPYKVGDRIGQLYFDTTEPIRFIEVDNLEETERGDGGFGSTGK